MRGRPGLFVETPGYAMHPVPHRRNRPVQPLGVRGLVSDGSSDRLSVGESWQILHTLSEAVAMLFPACR